MCSQTPPPGKQYNKGLKALAKAAQSFHVDKNVGKYRAYASSAKSLRLTDFFDEPSGGRYYTYYGSLTHPPCFNNTRYAVYETPIYMSQLDVRFYLHLKNSFTIKWNVFLLLLFDFTVEKVPVHSKPILRHDCCRRKLSSIGKNGSTQ